MSPRILLIACPIEYYKDNYQYASLSTLLTQEQEWVRCASFTVATSKSW